MGYEVKLIVGEPSSAIDKEYEREKTPLIDGKSVYFPYAKNEHGELKETGRTKTYFQICSIVDLCKIGSGPLSKLLEKSRVKNKKPKHYHFWYFDGNTEETEDCYGDTFVPVNVADVVKALKKEIEVDTKKGEEPYRRFVWALGLLESIKDKDIKVLFYGH